MTMFGGRGRAASFCVALAGGAGACWPSLSLSTELSLPVPMTERVRSPRRSRPAVHIGASTGP